MKLKKHQIFAIALTAMIIPVAATIIVLTVIMDSSYNPPAPSPTTVATPPIEELLTDQTEQIQGDFTVSNARVSSSGSQNTINATLTYIGTDASATARVAFILFNTENNQLQGRKYITLENLVANEPRDFEIIIVGEYQNSNSFKIEVQKP
jgi:hypothetical protein